MKTLLTLDIIITAIAITSRLVRILTYKQLTKMEITEELINNFLNYKRNEWKSEKTLYTYTYNFKAFHHWLVKNNKYNVEEIDKLTIEDYKAFLFSLWGSKYSRYWKQEKLCSWTINQKLVVVKNFLEFTNYVFDIGMDYRDVKLNKVQYKPWDYFTIEELKEIIKAINKTEKYRINQLRLRLIIALCFVSWARLDEMRQITISWIREWKQKITGKNKKDRYIFFNDTCRKILEEYLKEQEKDIPRLWIKLKRKTDFAVIWHWYENFWNQIWKQAITEMFKRLNDYLNLGKHLTLHTLRHSYATAMVDSWTNPFHLKELMGHAKLNTTMWYYHKNRNILATEQQKVFHDIEL